MDDKKLAKWLRPRRIKGDPDPTFVGMKRDADLMLDVITALLALLRETEKALTPPIIDSERKKVLARLRAVLGEGQ